MSTSVAPKGPRQSIELTRNDQIATFTLDDGELIKVKGVPGLYLRQSGQRKWFELRTKLKVAGKPGRTNAVTRLGDWSRDYTLKNATSDARARGVKAGKTAAPRLTLAQALEEHRVAHEEQGKPEERWRAATRRAYGTYRKYLIARLGPRPLPDIQRNELALAFRSYTGRGLVAANRCASFAISFFKWAQGEGLIENNPAAALGDKQKQPGGSEESSARVLTDEEIRMVWALDHPNAKLMRALLLTGCRISELQKATQAHLDGDDVLVIPAENSKNTKPHRLFLVPEVREQFDGHPPRLFRNVSATGVQAWARRLQINVDGDESPREPWFSLRPVNEVTGKPMEAWTPHDMRRTFATLAARAHVLPHIIVRLIGQTPTASREMEAISKTLGTYQRFEYAEERRAATFAVAALVKEIVNGK